MKIIKVSRIVSFIVETDDEVNSIYTRYSSSSWTVRMGCSDEPLFDCGEIELLYQEWKDDNGK